MKGLSKPDELMLPAARIVITDQNATTKHLSETLRIGYRRAARLMEFLHKQEIVSGLPFGAKSRSVLIPVEQLDVTMARVASVVNAEKRPENDGLFGDFVSHGRPRPSLDLHDNVEEMRRAARRVASEALDAEDCSMLLSMLGLSGPAVAGARAAE